MRWEAAIIYSEVKTFRTYQVSNFQFQGFSNNNFLNNPLKDNLGKYSKFEDNLK